MVLPLSRGCVRQYWGYSADAQRRRRQEMFRQGYDARVGSNPGSAVLSADNSALNPHAARILWASIFFQRSLTRAASFCPGERKRTAFLRNLADEGSYALRPPRMQNTPDTLIASMISNLQSCCLRVCIEISTNRPGSFPPQISFVAGRPPFTGPRLSGTRKRYSRCDRRRAPSWSRNR